MGLNANLTAPGYHSIYLSSSYYTLCNGSNGACAGENGLPGCSNSASNQAAWVNLNGVNTLSCSCGSVESSDLPSFSCGNEVIVTDLCTDITETITITDSATVPCVCESNCSNGPFMRAMDMTEGTFKYFESGSIVRGHIPILLQY